MSFIEYFAIAVFAAIIVIAGFCAWEFDKSMRDDE